MLQLLHIENIAVIDEADITFDEGFVALTGETGAGKSIVIDAMGAVLGQRTSRDLIRTGAGKSFVSAMFTGVPELPDKLLQKLHVPVGKDRRHKFALFAVRTRDAHVPLELPFPALRVPCAPGIVAVPCRRVPVPPGPKKVRCDLCRPAPCNAVHLYLHPDGLFLRFLNLPCRFFVHPFYLRFVCFPFRQYTYSL